MFKNIFYYSKLIILSVFLRKKYNHYKLLNDKDYNILIKNINDCGCICIKCIQWMIPILENQNVDENLISKLNNLYHDCTIYHDIEYTKTQYKKAFYQNIEQNYDICEIIGSGSIATAYKIKSKKDEKYYVMKIIHPQIKTDIIFFKRLLRIIYNIRYFKNLFYEYFPFDLIEFLEDFYKQSDFINECNNLIKFKKDYENVPYIIIPELYKSSQNIIIMEYIEGVCIDDTDISEYNKSKIINLVYLFIRNNLDILNNNHGDLHKYNWAVSKDKKDNLHKIIIYDFGYCFELTDEETFYITSICKLIINFDKNNDDHIKKYHNFLKYIFDDDTLQLDDTFDHNITKPDILLNLILKISKGNKLYIKKIKVLNTILLSCLVDNYFNHYNINTNETISEIRKGQLDSHIFCETYNIFPELSQLFFDEYERSKPNDTEGLFESIKFSDKIKSMI